MNEKADLTVQQVSKVADCHRNTVINYERKGQIQSFRDANNFRRFPITEALKLKKILETRLPTNE